MNTKNVVNELKKEVKTESEEKPKKDTEKSNFEWAIIGESSDSSISKVIQALNSVDLNSPDAEKNAHSISDNNGGRIELNEDDGNIIKK